MKIFEGKRILVMGGTGSLGQTLVRRIMTDHTKLGEAYRIIIFSRDEAKQHQMRVDFMNLKDETESSIYRNFEKKLQFVVGDIRDYQSVCDVLPMADIVINAAALKQVPTCEYFPYEAVQTNILGAANVIRAIKLQRLKIETVVGVSTDKACKPVNVMGMTKAIHERIVIHANLDIPETKCVCVRYGNVLDSRGSAIPLFRKQIESGGPVTITTPEMTRFLISLDQAVDTVFAAIAKGRPGETYIPKVQSSKMVDVAKAMIGKRDIPVKYIGIRPGEKIHEILVSEEEIGRTIDLSDYYAIQPILPEINQAEQSQGIAKEYSSADFLLSLEETVAVLRHNRLLMD